MKTLSKYFKVAHVLLLWGLVVYVGCRTNKNDPTASLPILGNVKINDIKTTSVQASCSISKVGVGSDGSSSIKEYGICYATKEKPTISDTKLKAGEKTDIPVDFQVTISGLTANTKYYVRAYVLHEGDPVYSEELAFSTTAQKAPEVTTGTGENITSTSLEVSGKIANIGSSDVVQHGHVLSETNQTPTTSDFKTELGTANAPKDYKSGFSGLKANTTYYVRAYATNAAGTGYGSVATIKTANVVASTVTTGNVTNITTSSADVGVTRNTLGTTTNGQVGICWSSTNQTPTIADTKRENGSSNAPEFFNINLTNLNPNTTYYVRGYATTAAGTGYGEVKSFKTNAAVPTIGYTSASFSTIVNLESDDDRIALRCTLTTNGAQIVEYGFVVHDSKTANPTLDNNVLKVVSTTSINGYGVILSGIKKADIAKLEATNNFRAYIKTTDGVYYGSSQTFSYTYPPEFSSLKFDCNGTSFTVTKYSRTPQITEIGEIEILSTNYAQVTPQTLPPSTSYTTKGYFSIPSGDNSYALYVYNTTGKLISLLPSANGKVYTTNRKTEGGSLQAPCSSYPWRLVIPYVKMANGTVYYPNPPSIKPVEKCFIDCTVK